MIARSTFSRSVLTPDICRSHITSKHERSGCSGRKPDVSTGQVYLLTWQRDSNRNIPKGWTKSNSPMYEDSLTMGAMIKARNVAYAMNPLGFSETRKGEFCLWIRLAPETSEN